MKSFDDDVLAPLLTLGTASIICVDLIVRKFPGMKNFKIEDSNAFLSTGLSLSFGVMVCGVVCLIWDDV